MTKKPKFSIIIPIRVENDYLKETLKHLHSQSYKSYEILVITDKISNTSNPSIKRNIGAKMAKGDYLAFLDDDSYPHHDWLQNTFQLITNHPDFSAFCGPALTPPNDDIYQQASGYVWSSFLGSGGAGIYRSQISSPRFVDDYPTVNFIVKKTVFDQIGGFNPSHWPGEDTIFCLDLINQSHKIYYHPSIIVYHHRRSVFRQHLAQTNRYALHRGHFARIYPKNSLKLGYIIPSLFLFYLILIPFHQVIWPLYVYLFLLLLTTINIFLHSKSLKLSFLSSTTIVITHLAYGLNFIKGFFTPRLIFKPREL